MPRSWIRLSRRKDATLDARSRALIEDWTETKKSYAGDEQVVKCASGKSTPGSTRFPFRGPSAKVALPGFEDHGEILKWRMRENLPGSFPFTAGVFSFKRENEDPTRMFAARVILSAPTAASICCRKTCGEAPLDRVRFGDALRIRPGLRPDIYGKVGNSACPSPRSRI